MRRFYTRLLFLSLLIITSIQLFSQYATEWSITTGATGPDHIHALALTTDGGVIAAGLTYSDEISGYHGPYGSDAWCSRVSNTGEVEWSRSYGSYDDDEFYDIIALADGDFIAVGKNHEASGDVSVNTGSSDVWAVRLNPSGDIIWEHSYGDESVDQALKIISAGENKFLLLCQKTISDETAVYGFQNDYLLIEINGDGEIIWERTYGGSESEYPSSIIIDENNDIVMCGAAMSDDGDVVGHTFFGDVDAWFLKTDSAGNILDSRCSGGLQSEYFNDIIQPDAGRYYLLSTYLLGDLSCNTELEYDFQLCQSGDNGNVEWQKCYGGGNYDFNAAIVPDLEGYFIAGVTMSSSIPGYHGSAEYDFYVVKINPDGNQTWQYCYGGTEDDINGVDIVADRMGGFYIGGTTESSDGDVLMNHGSSDGLIVKVTCDGTAEIFADGDTEICTADSVLLYTHYVSGATWKWLKDGNEIPLANDTSFMCHSPGNYQVEVSFATNCMKLSEMIPVTDTCAVDTVAMEMPFGIYPNPAAGDFTIACTNESACKNPYDIFIYNMNGTLVKEIVNQMPGTPNHLNLFLKQGFYMIVVKENNGKQYHLPFIIAY